MNTSQLRYVMAVAETRSFTLAAERCFVTQPTLSNGIAQLEEEFGDRLFTRTTRAVSLTPFGERILPFVGKVLDAQAELLREAGSFVHPSRMAVRIGTSPLIRADWLASMLETFRKTHPDVEVILHEQNMADLYRMLDEDLLDFVFGVADAQKPSWGRAFLYREPLYFTPRGENGPGPDETVPFADIAEETFVMVPNVCGLARATRALFRSHRRKLTEYPGEALSYQVLEEWAALGLGAAILPQSKLRATGRRAYALTDKKGNGLTLDFEAVWLKAPQRPAHLERFTEHLAKPGE
ncbi:Helix-turn-helix transcriptional regulator, LysR family [uncultured delta proteobacterium]|uniref:Helix-turn-helix transcriptional regulator, LysR family n=1 Tax=uncultured delta proteobacterium TaxID=34034 RepID=A0A212KD25_9DELT|nr:Helix-turn-helix transcriptional regulator, LysR family [uncultured delta proteobacterium]